AAPVPAALNPANAKATKRVAVAQAPERITGPNTPQAPHVVIADVSPQLSLMKAMSEQAKQVNLPEYQPKLGPKVIRVTPSSEALLKRGETKFVFEN
ncbi:MAG: hypothetical protein J0L97_10955, partial [Alphaproteobacteria bacterium]|nr:hypothetical protein [Alphaproteobacteria bacterium]